MYMIRIHPVTSCNTEFWPICINIRLQNVRVSLQCTVLKNYLLARTEEISHEDQGTESLYRLKCHSFDYVNKKAKITLDGAKRLKQKLSVGHPIFTTSFTGDLLPVGFDVRRNGPPTMLPAPRGQSRRCPATALFCLFMESAPNAMRRLLGSNDQWTFDA